MSKSRTYTLTGPPLNPRTPHNGEFPHGVYGEVHHKQRNRYRLLIPEFEQDDSWALRSTICGAEFGINRYGGRS